MRGDESYNHQALKSASFSRREQHRVKSDARTSSVVQLEADVQLCPRKNFDSCMIFGPFDQSAASQTPHCPPFLAGRVLGTEKTNQIVERAGMMNYLRGMQTRPRGWTTNRHILQWLRPCFVPRKGREGKERVRQIPKDHPNN